MDRSTHNAPPHRAQPLALLTCLTIAGERDDSSVGPSRLRWGSARLGRRRQNFHVLKAAAEEEEEEEEGAVGGGGGMLLMVEM
jgi:hypothetical protein